MHHALTYTLSRMRQMSAVSESVITLGLRRATRAEPRLSALADRAYRDVKAMVLAGTEFEVRDAKTGDDLTRSILLQIILEEESGGLPMFSTETLAQIIRFYGHAMQGLMGAYLEKNLQSFTEFQSRLMEQTRGLSDPKAYTPEMWTQFLSGQAPVMQNLMTSYLEQSRGLFEKMQEQMKLPGGLFPGFPPTRK